MKFSLKILKNLFVVTILLLGAQVSGFRSLKSSASRGRVITMKAFSTKNQPVNSQVYSAKQIVQQTGTVFCALLVSAQITRAANVQESNLADSKRAAMTIKEALAKIDEIEKVNTDYEAIGKILGEDCFLKFSENAFILTKSSALTPDDKVALGTIKRYGLVADAIIMIGGLSEALRAGGIEVAGGGGGYADQAAIEVDDDAADEDAEKKVDSKEVKKYIQLVRGAFEDINKITAPILNK